MANLPGILAIIADVAGEAAALRLAQMRGGTAMKFSCSAKSPLTKIVGAEAARLIVAELGAARYVIPMANARGRGARQALAARLLDSGQNAQQVAQAADIHERTARRLRKKLKQGMPLFDRD